MSKEMCSVTATNGASSMLSLCLSHESNLGGGGGDRTISYGATTHAALPRIPRAVFQTSCPATTELNLACTNHPLPQMRFVMCKVLLCRWPETDVLVLTALPGVRRVSMAHDVMFVVLNALPLCRSFSRFSLGYVLSRVRRKRHVKVVHLKVDRICLLRM